MNEPYPLCLFLFISLLCVCVCVGHTVGVKIEGRINQYVYHSILQLHAIPSSLHLVGLSFVFQQDDDPKHTSRLSKSRVHHLLVHHLLELAASDHLTSTILQSKSNWDSLGCVWWRMKVKRPTSSHQLWKLLPDCLNIIPDDHQLWTFEASVF